MRNSWLIVLTLVMVLLGSCNPDAPWTTKDVVVTMKATTISSGYAEFEFSTDKEAYYFIDCVPAREDVNPLDYPKQFMMLALDSANT